MPCRQNLKPYRHRPPGLSACAASASCILHPASCIHPPPLLPPRRIFLYFHLKHAAPLALSFVSSVWRFDTPIEQATSVSSPLSCSISTGHTQTALSITCANVLLLCQAHLALPILPMRPYFTFFYILVCYSCIIYVFVDILLFAASVLPETQARLYCGKLNPLSHTALSFVSSPPRSSDTLFFRPGRLSFPKPLECVISSSRHHLHLMPEWTKNMFARPNRDKFQCVVVRERVSERK